MRGERSPRLAGMYRITCTERDAPKHAPVFRRVKGDALSSTGKGVQEWVRYA